MVAYLKTSPQEKTYSDYLKAAREAKKEYSMEPSQSQTANKTAKPKLTSFFPLQKLKGTWPLVKIAAVHLAHLEEENTEEDEEVHSVDPDGKSHFIHDCSLVKTSRTDSNLNCKEGMVPKKGAQAPQMKATMPKMLLEGASKAWSNAHRLPT